MNGSHHVPTKKSVVSKDEWNTKEGTGKSIKNVLYAQKNDKGTSRAEATLSSEKNMPVALAIVEICKSEGISQSGS